MDAGKSIDTTIYDLGEAPGAKRDCDTVVEIERMAYSADAAIVPQHRI